MNEIPKNYAHRNIYSFSRLSSFKTCPHGYMLNYIEKSKGEDNIYSLLGTFVHESLEKMQFGEISNNEVLELFDVKVFELINILGYKFPTEKTQTNFIECIKHFIKHYKPIECKDFKSELRFYTEVEGVVLTGFIDAIVVYNDNSISVIDYKTSSKFSSKDLEEKGLQLALYAYALMNEFSVKIDSVKFNMLKYATITWQGKSTERRMFVQRNKLVESLRSELKKDLRSLEYGEVHINMMLDNAENSNDLNLLPHEVIDKYTVSDGYVEYIVDDVTIEALKYFVRHNVACIEGLDPCDAEAWRAKEITLKDNFYCSQLCSYKTYCRSYQSFIKKYSEYLEQ